MSGWQSGQQAVISRQTIVTIERVTPSGRAVANGRTFESDGHERCSGDPWRRGKLEPLTPDIQAEMDLVERGRAVSADADKAIKVADRWLRDSFSSWGRRVPELADVERAGKLAAAIRQALE